MICGITRERCALLAVYSALSTRFKIEDASSDVWILALADLAFAVEIPDRLRQGFEHIRSLFFQNIVDVMHRCDIGLSPFKGFGDAEQPHKVRVVCMEELAIET